MKRVVRQKRKINLKLAIYILIITTVLAVITSTAKFGTTVIGSGNAIVAVPVLETARINLENINPQMSEINYDLVIKNTKDNIKNEVTLNYTIVINHLGNVPLVIKLYNTENGKLVGDDLLKDGQTDAITMPIEEKVHTYRIVISWDKTINDYDSYLYSGETSYVEIKVDAVQKD